MRQRFNRRHFAQSLLAGAAAAAGLPARAEPARGVCFGFNGKFAPGLLQVLKEIQGHYQPDLGTNVTMMGGNAGARALEAVRDGPADGGTVLLCPSGNMTLRPPPQPGKAPLSDPLTGLVPVAMLGEFAMALIAGPTVPAEVKSFSDFLAWVRRIPTDTGYGVFGVGISPHFVGMAMTQRLEIPLKPVVYRGQAAMLSDLAAGGIPVAFATSNAVEEPGWDRRFRFLAVTNEQRWPWLPDVPTLLESGAVDFGFTESFGLFMSTRVPAEKVTQLNEAIRNAQRTPAVIGALNAAMMRSRPVTPEEYAELLKAESRMWTGVVKRTQPAPHS